MNAPSAPQAAVPRVEHTVNAENPWPGLWPFLEVDRAYFQGRAAETEELLRLVLRERLIVLFGLSGLGKSSLLQAGLFPRVRRESIFPVYIRLDFSGRQPDMVAQVTDAILREAKASRIEAPGPAGTLWEYFHRRDGDFWNERNRPVVPLLVFDQFEEIFTLGRTDAARVNAVAALLDELSDLAEGRPPAALKARLDERPEGTARFTFSRHPYKLLFSVREDFLPDLEGLRARFPSIVLNRLRLRRMDGVAALTVVNQAPTLIEAAVAEQVVRFVAANPHADTALADLKVEPALLSVVCRELNNKRQQRSEPRITADLLEGTQAQVLNDFYERSVADLAPEMRTFIEERMLTVSGYRDSVALENALREPGVNREAIEQLVRRRLIRIEDRDGIPRLEVTHDLLTGVIRASRDKRRQRAAELARQEELGRQAEERRRQQQEELETQARLERERRLESDARAGRIFKRAMIAAAAAMIVLIALVAAAFYQRNQADLERQRAMVSSAEAQRQRTLSDSRLNLITNGIRMKQAVLSGARDSIETFLNSKLANRRIRFAAEKKYLGYKNPAGQDIFKYQLYPDPQTVPGGLATLAVVTYRMDHPTFQNGLLATGPETRFTASYIGWGCLTRVIVLIEYVNPETSPEIAEFDMCGAIPR